MINVSEHRVYAPVCSHCHKPFNERAHRPLFVKTFLFWLPLSRYYCFRCNRKAYVVEFQNQLRNCMISILITCPIAINTVKTNLEDRASTPVAVYAPVL